MSNQDRAMKLTLVTAFMIAGLATVAFGSPAETELKALEQQWSDAYKKGDTAVLKAVEAEEWILVDPEGTTTTKAQDIKELDDKTFVVKESTNSDVKVRMLGDDHAAITGSGKMSGLYKNKEFSGEYRFIDIFEKKGGKWQAIMSQVTKVQKE
jgi:ketosteroid isomerase-like protein